MEFCQVDSGFDEEGLFEVLLGEATKRVRDFAEFRECVGQDLHLDFYPQGDFHPSKNLSPKTLEHIQNLIGENVEGYLALNPKQIAWECAKGKLESVLKKFTQNHLDLSGGLREKTMQEVLKEGVLACDSVVVVHLPHITKNLNSNSAPKSAIAPNPAFASKSAITSKPTQYIILDSSLNHTCTNLLLRKAKTPTQARIMLELQSGNPISIITAFAYQSHKGFFCNIDCAEFLLGEFCQDDIECYVKSSLWQGSAGCVKVEGFHKGYIISQKGLDSCALGLGFERILPFLGII